MAKRLSNRLPLRVLDPDTTAERRVSVDQEYINRWVDSAGIHEDDCFQEQDAPF
jgi:hypothetical protein